MRDPRLEKLAKVLVHYSLNVKKGQWVRIDGPYLAEELIRTLVVELLKTGAYPSSRVSVPGLAALVYKHASRDQLRFIPPSERLEMEKLDGRITLMGGWNTKELTSADPKKMAFASAVRKELMELMLKRTASGKFHWCGTMFPTQSAAQEAEMSLQEYEDFVFTAGKLDQRDPVAEWKRLSRYQARIIRSLGRLKTLRVVGPDTDLSFRVQGRKWVNCDGKENFPDGEVFTGPLEDSAEGHVRYSYPALYRGREVQNVRLVFKHGKATEARADKGEDYLNALLDSDPGARHVGELAFGTNYSIQRFTKNTLFDEKIGGTMHVAVGASLPETGGKNKSGLHWDMVLDTRKGFVVYGDGKPIHKDGKFLFRL